MGRDDARELATALIAAYEGIALLAAALRDPSLISTETNRLSLRGGFRSVLGSAGVSTDMREAAR